MVFQRLVDGLNDPNKCRADAGGAEDLEMGKCLLNVGVHPGDSRDELERERFHPFVPEHHLIPDILPKDMWYWSYNYYPAKQVGNLFLYFYGVKTKQKKKKKKKKKHWFSFCSLIG